MNIKARFPGRCANCNTFFHEGDDVDWDSTTKQVTGPCCIETIEDPTTTSPTFSPKNSTAGGSDLPEWEDDVLPF